jgi:Protein of unknown function (DUF3040)
MRRRLFHLAKRARADESLHAGSRASRGPSRLTGALRAKCETEECEATAKGYAWPETVGREVDQTMELSARDKRILADIECESALDDPHWVRRFERLGRGDGGGRRGWRRVGLGVLVLLVLAVWTAAVVIGALVLRPLLWAALAGLGAGLGTVLLRRRHVYGYWYRPRRRITRIPEQNPRGRTDGAES